MARLTRKNAAAAAQKRVRLCRHCDVPMHPSNRGRHRHLVTTNVVFTANDNVPRYYRPVNRSPSLDPELLSELGDGEYEGLDDSDDDEVPPAPVPVRRLFPVPPSDLGEGPSGHHHHTEPGQHGDSNPDRTPSNHSLMDQDDPPVASSSQMHSSQSSDAAPLPSSTPPPFLSSSPPIPASSPLVPLLPLVSSSPLATPPSPPSRSPSLPPPPSDQASAQSIWSDPRNTYEAMSPRSYYLNQLPAATSLDAMNELNMGKLRK